MKKSVVSEVALRCAVLRCAAPEKYCRFKAPPAAASCVNRQLFTGSVHKLESCSFQLVAAFLCPLVAQS